MAAPRRTATITLDRGEINQHTPQFRSVFGFQGQDTRPRTLRIDARMLVPSASDEQQRSLARSIGGAGVWWNVEIYDPGEGTTMGPDGVTVNGIAAPSPWDGGGALKLTYGSTPGISRTVFADLRAGEFNIPPCEAFDLAAAYWSPDDGVYAGELLELSAELADGESAESTPLILSATRRAYWPTNIDYDLVYPPRCAVPPGAYAFEVFAAGRTHLAARCGSVIAVRDFAGAWAPPTTPLLITGADAQYVRVWTDDPDPGNSDGGWPSWYPTIAFFVR